jgi:hypothetical protein
LLTADRLGTAAIMRQTGKSKSVVWRWQERFMQAGVDGLMRDKTRPPRIPPLDQPVIDRVVALTSTDPPGERRIGRRRPWPRWPASASARCSVWCWRSTRPGASRKTFQHYRAALSSLCDETARSEPTIARFREANTAVEQRLRTKLSSRVREIDAIYQIAGLEP